MANIEKYKYFRKIGRFAKTQFRICLLYLSIFQAPVDKEHGSEYLNDSLIIIIRIILTAAKGLIQCEKLYCISYVPWTASLLVSSRKPESMSHQATNYEGNSSNI